MARNTINILKEYVVKPLDDYIRSTIDPPDETKKYAILGNIATSELAGGDNSNINNAVVVSLVNIQEEGTLKNKPNSYQVGQQHYEQHAPVFLNLYVLFTANFDKESYHIAINRLLSVVAFFQGNRILDENSRLHSSLQNTELDNDNSQIALEVDLHTLNFEQVNDLWGSLGSKQMPFVLYRIRLLPIEIQKPVGRTSTITEVELITPD